MTEAPGQGQEPGQEVTEAGAEAPDLQEDGAPAPTFLGEVVQKRSWPVIAVVFVFALILAAAPFLFMAERSPYADALAAYDRLCAAQRDGRAATADLAADAPTGALAGLRCVDRQAVPTTFHPVPGHEYGNDRQFVLRFAGTEPFEMRFVGAGDRLVWRP